FATRRRLADPDIGAGFDLIVGTSTGAIIACALAAGVPLREVVNLYTKHGTSIFRRKLPTLSNLAVDLLQRPAAIAAGAGALRNVLDQTLGSATLGEIY